MFHSYVFIFLLKKKKKYNLQYGGCSKLNTFENVTV